MSTWVVGDIHGCYNTFMDMLNNPEIREGDTVILIGDIIDRGMNSLKILEWAKANISDSGQFQMICGNHENNIIDDYYVKKQIYERLYRGEKFEDAEISLLDCHYQFDMYMESAGYYTVGSVLPFIKWFETLPLTKHVTVTTPEGKVQKYIVAHGWYAKSFGRKDTVWYRDIDDRNRFLDDYRPLDNEILVHGHTPVFTHNGYPENATVHFREHSINVDCGCVFPQWGGRLAAIRLEDKKVIYTATHEDDTLF